LATAQQLTRVGHDVLVLERADRIGGLLRYGIPEFKMEKSHIERRVKQMTAEGTVFRTNAVVGENVDVDVLIASHDAVVLACGATSWRDLQVDGRELRGIHQAMEYLPPSNKVQQGDYEKTTISAEGKHVVIIGGGDTGADCLGTAIRQGAASITQLEILPQPPTTRAESNPWPQWSFIYRTSSAHEEGGERLFSVSTEKFVGDKDGNVRAMVVCEVKSENGKFVKVEGSERELKADLVLLALGFVGPEKASWLSTLGLDFDDRGNVARDDAYMSSMRGVFVAGDMGRGQSLIVWAIAEGRAAAAAVDNYLMGSTDLPAPIVASAKPLN
jgi:glutamate synthase (NADPH/NADH) small chain